MATGLFSWDGDVKWTGYTGNKTINGLVLVVQRGAGDGGIDMVNGLYSGT